jgi:hypothetical protein
MVSHWRSREMIGSASAFGMPTIVKLPKLVLGISDKL